MATANFRGQEGHRRATGELAFIMRSRCIPMTRAEFERLPREVGWRYEYVDGCANVRPGQVAAQLTVPITPRPVADTGNFVRAVTLQDAPALVRAFIDGFEDTVEYCDRSRAEVRWAGQSAIGTFFSGKRGAFHPASRLAVPPHRPRLIAGAALVVQKPDGPFLDMLFVRRRWRHRGLGTALVATAMNALLIAGEAKLGSAYNVANGPSIAWHHRFGFVETPNGALAALRLDLARHELWRRTQAGDLTETERRALEAEIARLSRVADSLASPSPEHPAAATGRSGGSPA